MGWGRGWDGSAADGAGPGSEGLSGRRRDWLRAAGRQPMGTRRARGSPRRLRPLSAVPGRAAARCGARPGPVRFRSVPFGPSRLIPARFGSARFVSPRLGPAAGSGNTRRGGGGGGAGGASSAGGGAAPRGWAGPGRVTWCGGTGPGAAGGGGGGNGTAPRCHSAGSAAPRGDNGDRAGKPRVGTAVSGAANGPRGDTEPPRAVTARCGVGRPKPLRAVTAGGRSCSVLPLPDRERPRCDTAGTAH